MHPTVKPVALIADALRDCSRRGEIVLDGFGGSGSTLIAAEKTGAFSAADRYDPLYCDTIIRRWEKFTGKRAVLCDTDSAFEDIADERRGVALGDGRMNARVPSTDFDRTDNDADQPSGHDVGYGKPPKKHRFKKGQSAIRPDAPRELQTRRDNLIQVINPQMV